MNWNVWLRDAVEHGIQLEDLRQKLNRIQHRIDSDRGLEWDNAPNGEVVEHERVYTDLQDKKAAILRVRLCWLIDEHAIACKKGMVTDPLGELGEFQSLVDALHDEILPEVRID